MSVTARSFKCGRFTFVLVSEDSKWHRIISSGKNRDGDIIETLSHEGGDEWRLETLVGASGASYPWYRTGYVRISPERAQSIAHLWRASL